MKIENSIYQPKLEDVKEALQLVRQVADQTPLQLNPFYSSRYKANIHLKREDLQSVRSYKIRGAFNKIAQLSESERTKGIVCASAGNHAQGVALACAKLKLKGAIFLPLTTPQQKIDQIELFGQEWISIFLKGDTFDDAQSSAKAYQTEYGATFIPPFDDEKVIEGQATIALELLEQSTQTIDYLILPVGGGGLASGISEIFALLSPETKIIGVEPKGAPSLKKALEKDYNFKLDQIDKFVDGAAVQKVGDLNFELCRKNLHDCINVDEGLICSTILELYNKNAIVAEPAGALSIAALKYLEDQIQGKNVVCLLSGGNNDSSRTEEIRERAMIYENRKHYFIVRFPQRAGALKEFVLKVLGPEDDITYFQYNKKNSRTRGSAVIGIEMKDASGFDSLVSRMKEFHFFETYLNENENLLNFLV